MWGGNFVRMEYGSLFEKSSAKTLYRGTNKTVGDGAHDVPFESTDSRRLHGA